MIPLNRILAAALTVGALASIASAARAAPAPPAGDAAGIELAQKVNAFYAAPARVAVEIRSPVPSGVISVRVILVRGKTKAMIFTAAVGKERVTSAATTRGAFVREPGARCWTKLASGDASSGSPMIVLSGSKFFAPESIGALARLEVLERDPGSGTRTRTAYKVDAETGRIAAIVMDGVGMNVRTLPRVPALPSFKPVCKP